MDSTSIALSWGSLVVTTLSVEWVSAVLCWVILSEIDDVMPLVVGVVVSVHVNWLRGRVLMYWLYNSDGLLQLPVLSGDHFLDVYNTFTSLIIFCKLDDMKLVWPSLIIFCDTRLLWRWVYTERMLYYSSVTIQAFREKALKSFQLNN